LPDLAVGEKLKIAVIYRQDGKIVTPKDAGWYSAELDLENCAFYDIDGNEIEGGVNNYSVECAPLDSLKINKFEFIIKPLDLTKENGAEVTYGDEVKYPDYLGNYFGLSSKEAGAYDIKELPYGEQIKIIGLNRITDKTGNDVPDKLNVGTYRITAGYIAVFDSYGNAIQFNSNYQFTASEFADLEVVPREITVTVDDKTATYGEALPENSFTITKGALQYDEELTITAHYEQGGAVCAPETWEGYTLLNAGTYSIIYNNDETIVGGNASVDNYAFEFVAGTLEITARVIYYATADGEKVYDGTALYNTSYETYLLSDNTKAGLLNGDALTVLKNPASIEGVQKRPNHNYYSVPNNNYYIDDSATVFGWLEVTPRPIVIELSAIDEVTYGETFVYKDEAGNYANSPDLANGEKLKIAVIYKQDGSIVTPKNAGTYTAELDLENCTFYYADGTEIKDGVKNYEIECAPLENLKIKQFEFEIIPLAFTKENGNALTYGDELNYPDYIGNYFGFVDGNITELPYGENIKILDLYYYADHIFGSFPKKLE
ncbi:MAG: hypothetical protein K2K04_06530, partial [Clostridia bacterium]|nr:hypothetical protein [Clostridia bacterium]